MRGGDDAESQFGQALDLELSQVRMRALSALQSSRVVESVLSSAQGETGGGTMNFSEADLIELENAVMYSPGFYPIEPDNRTARVLDTLTELIAMARSVNATVSRLDRDFREIRERYPMANERTTRPEPSPAASIQKPKRRKR